MMPQREIRYYASIPRNLFRLVVSGGFTAIGWLLWTSQRSGWDAIRGGVALGFFGLLTVTSLMAFIQVVALRKPLLTINERGFTLALLLAPWRTHFIPWTSARLIGIRVQQFRGKTYFFVVDVRTMLDGARPARFGFARLSSALFPSLAPAAIVVRLSELFFFTSATRRAEMMDHIQAEFATEIARYHVDVDSVESPL